MDDEAVIREVTKASLEKYNYRVLTASDGLDAIAVYAQKSQEIQEYFLSQPESFSKALLLLYLKIWQQDSGIINNSAETQQLIALGLVIRQNNKLKVANR